MVGVVSVCVYVDDILITSSNKISEEVVVGAISGVVPTKTTGLILPSSEGGGNLTFIGRNIHRRKGEVALYLSVDPQYLMPVFEDYQVKKGSNAAPDVASFLEKTDDMSVRPLTNEGYTKFRKALGKLLWLSQVRHDLKLWLSLIGSLQSKPIVGADNAFKSVVRFMFSDRYVQLRLPSGSDQIVDEFKGVTMRHMPRTALTGGRECREKSSCTSMAWCVLQQSNSRWYRYLHVRQNCTPYRRRRKTPWAYLDLCTDISSVSGNLMKKHLFSFFLRQTACRRYNFYIV